MRREISSSLRAMHCSNTSTGMVSNNVADDMVRDYIYNNIQGLALGFLPRRVLYSPNVWTVWFSTDPMFGGRELYRPNFYEKVTTVVQQPPANGFLSPQSSPAIREPRFPS